jgi:polyhydroxyalkanoate synthase
MFPPFLGLPTATNVMLQQALQIMERMQGRFDTVFKLMLNADPVTVAQTPADVVYSEGKLRLLHYRAVVERQSKLPLLIVPSLLNRYYILDLAPGKSLVEYLVGQGFDVYLLDWGAPGPEDRYITFDQYLTGYMRRMVQQVRSRSGQEQISLLGYSMGGTLTAIFSALYGQYIRNLIQIAAPINFHDDGLISQWTRKERFNVDLVVDTLGTMPVALMQASFRMLMPTAQILQHVALAEKFGDMEAVQDLLAMQTWLADTTACLGEAYRKYLKECYQENYLIQGKLVIDRQRVDLSRIDCALLTITAAKDYMCPPQSAAVLDEIVASTDKLVIELPSGHIGSVVGRTAMEQLWPRLAAWLHARSADQPPASDQSTAAEAATYSPTTAIAAPAIDAPSSDDRAPDIQASPPPPAAAPAADSAPGHVRAPEEAAQSPSPARKPKPTSSRSRRKKPAARAEET